MIPARTNGEVAHLHSPRRSWRLWPTEVCFQAASATAEFFALRHAGHRASSSDRFRLAPRDGHLEHGIAWTAGA
jgi:hypothetical protein